jgi:hypothetical protein
MRFESVPRLAFRYKLNVAVIGRVVELDVIVNEWSEDLDGTRDLLQCLSEQLPRHDASSDQGAFLVVQTSDCVIGKRWGSKSGYEPLHA